MRVSLGKFAKSGIEERFGPDLGAGALEALAHYVQRLKDGIAPLGPPAFLENQAEVAEESFELTLETETEEALRCEALRHQVPVERILAHAVLTYLADVDRVHVLAAPTASLQPMPL